MEPNFPELKGRLGFGCMRLPVEDGKVNIREFTAMADAYLNAGFCYFDTAHGYLDGGSELAIRECVTSRYPRDRFVLTDKLSGSFLNRAEDVRPFFEHQLEACGVSFFDFYLMHSQSAESYAKFQRLHCYETIMELKAEGKLRHFGISFHDTAEFLEKILTEHPEIEVVQIQLNYVDVDDPAVQSRKCYEVCRKFGKPVFVMEPVKGGSLAALPEDAAALFSAMGGSPADCALRFAAGFPQVRMILSGMSTLAQMEENIRTMSDPAPLTPRELETVEQAAACIHARKLIGCTACRYCTAGCPRHISIPDLFACMNAWKQYQDWSSAYYYQHAYTVHNGRASDCIRCGQCEKICPQHLPIRALLQEAAQIFETD